MLLRHCLTHSELYFIRNSNGSLQIHLTVFSLIPIFDDESAIKNQWLNNPLPPHKIDGIKKWFRQEYYS